MNIALKKVLNAKETAIAMAPATSPTRKTEAYV
jgi:hypothetical protein